MSTGNYNGDERQASHWKADEFTGTLIGILDPTVGSRTAYDLSPADMRALDMIGYDHVACTDGGIDYGEGYDDSNVSSGDGCSSSCQLDASGSACTADANPCTDDTCNGSGGCQHVTRFSGSCNDGNFYRQR